jgi:hypothetical protein
VTPPRSTLLRDLAALVKRYPSREWVRLARLLEDDHTRSQVVSLLKEVGGPPGPTAARRTRTAPENSKSAVPRSDVDSRERFELDLSRSSIAKLRHIARGYGIPFSTKDSRQRLRKKLLTLAQGGEIKISDASKAIASKGQGDYARWAEIIIKGSRPGR